MVAIVEIELRNTVAPLRSHIMSSSVGVMYLSRWIAVLGMRMSTHMRTSFGDFGFGTATIGDTHGVGSSTFSIISISSSLTSYSSTFLLTWNGILR